MSNLDNITKKIAEDARAEAAAIIERAKANADRAMGDLREHLQSDLERQMVSERERAQVLQERLVSNMNLQARDLILQAKQETISRCFALAKQKLILRNNDLTQEHLAYKLQQDQMAKDALLVLPENSTVKPPAGMQVQYSSEVEAGYRLIKDGITENYDFLELLEFMREDLEIEVVEMLSKVKY